MLSLGTGFGISWEWSLGEKKINISNLLCINLDGLIYMLTSANTCTHVCELACEAAACCLFMRGLLQSLTAARQCVQQTGRVCWRASAQKHGKDAYFD